MVEDGKAYVSWNGATDVTGWAVYVGEGTGNLECVGIAERKGFETAFTLAKDAKYIQVAAVQGGSEVRKSNLVKV